MLPFLVRDRAGFPTVLKAIEELIKWLYDIREVENETPVEVIEAKENLYIPVGLWMRPFLNRLDTGRVYSYPVLINEKSKVFQLRLKELALLGISV